ncbi:MAG TPA: MFS transporter [Solirubrobacteraceae bacterium]|nr:MFS transporter [Solirubrobacteraceae bacterium]
MRSRTRIRDLLRAAFANAELRRVGLAYAGFNAAEWGVWIALLVYAYGHGGATAASVAAVVQLVPAGLFAPFAARMADRGAPARVLLGGYLAQSVTMSVTAVALLAGAPPAAVFVLAGLAASATTFTRPAQAALVPALVRRVDELTSANVVLGWIESIGLLVAPAVAGALLAVSVPAAVFAVMAALALVSAVLVAPVRGPAPPAPDACDGDSLAVAGELLAGARVVGADPQARLLVGVLGMEFVLIGALDVLFVVLAIEVLDLGGSGAGYLNAAFGAGGVIGIALTVRLVGRARLVPALVAASLAWSLALLALGLWHAAIAAFLLLALAGAGRVVLDVAARTLLQRSAPPGVLARVFGVLETLDAIGLAIGSALAAVLVAALGPGGAVAGLAVLLPAMLALAARRLHSVDEGADVPVVEVALLRSHPIFSSLGPPALEGLARGMTALSLPAGACVIREGAPGERYYVVADGRLEVSRGTTAIAEVARGDGVGEISLLAGVPCSATVTAMTDVELLAIEPTHFIEVVTGHPVSARTADRLVRERLETR